MPTLNVETRHDLTDTQWNVLEPLLPAPTHLGRPCRYRLRDLINGIRHRIRIGCPWRDVPARYGPWWRVYALFKTWQCSGMWAQIEATLQSKADAQGTLGWDLAVDSTTSRAHVHAAGARRDSPQHVEGEPADHALGRSRGGFSTKIHLACDGYLQSVSFTITAGQAGDSPQLTEVLDRIKVDRPGRGRPRTRPNRVLADKAYSSKAIRAHLRRRGIKTTIPVKEDQAKHRKARGHRGGRPPAFDAEVYKARNVVERCFNALKHKRGVATRYDKLAVRFEATVRVANIDRWLKRLS
ncbi:IS5 family transposase [Corynebacterium alimapuense]|uniref:IS5/IS1182 family transposase n=1 Tax=Corynebacterium alimapuense TaxID=1576874 RepID=A0A3M8KAZ6_9CORY|nr:IS5 family transposase [Corynebacterium alimapuense]RNE49965.1 IS5/IS1182 family transposase [Corynebacterium alimapuense]